MKKVQVVIPLQKQHKDILENISRDYEIHYSTPQTITNEEIASADIIIGNIPANRIKASPKLKLLQLNSAGADEYIKEGVLSSDTIIANSTGAYDKTVAEHAFGLTIELMKKLYLYRDNQKKKKWADMGLVTSLENATVVIVGCGSIGTQYAKYVKAFGAYVIGVKTKPSPLPECIDELCLAESISSVLSRADIIVSFLPQTINTIHFYNIDFFNLMKPTSFFINCGRGSAVSSQVLYKALSEHLIEAAAVDVTEVEPLDSSSPLWSLENLVITPHTAGGYHLPDTLDKIVAIASHNLHALAFSEPLMNIVDRKTGYKI